MTNAAQIDRHPELEAIAETPEPFALKQQVAERLAAHRARRAAASPVAAPAISASRPEAPRPARARSAAIAAAVAERYAASPSYRAVLAEESARAVHQRHRPRAAAASC